MVFSFILVDSTTRFTVQWPRDLLTWSHKQTKGSREQKSNGLSRKRRDCENVYICRHCMVVLSIFMPQKYFFPSNLMQLSVRRSNAGSTFTNEEQKLSEMLAREASIHFFYARGRPCRWRHIHRMPGTKWQRSRPCLGDFQTSIFHQLGHKSADNLLWVSLYFIPVLSIGSPFRVPIKWILENASPIFGSCHP